MYWLLDQKEQIYIRDKIKALTEALAEIGGNPQADQLFPYVGRKDRRKAVKVVEILTSGTDLVIEPFGGSGSLIYAIAESGRRSWVANEWEPYAWRMSNAPWMLPKAKELKEVVAQLKRVLDPHNRYYYKCVCSCRHEHVLDSFFFDRVPLSFRSVSSHERLGAHGENITYRGPYACPSCGREEKFFDDSDEAHLKRLSKESVSKIYRTPLIENSRINLSRGFLIYGNLFPHRSKLALDKIWHHINQLQCSKASSEFLISAFLSILPQAKYKDYRSKSQDLHCPDIKLREVNLFYRFFTQIERRNIGLRDYSFSEEGYKQPIQCKDFRVFMRSLKENSAALVLTDPPWCDGNAYFEKAQLYHPWLGYSLKNDVERLEKEFVVTDAPSRRRAHDMDRWWKDMDGFFSLSRNALKNSGVLALFFRPIPARQWLTNLNKLKLLARKNGFEPLLSIDVGSSDPSMRIQQSATYVFSQDIIFLFLKLDPAISRIFSGDVDIDQIVFETAEKLQEAICGPFTFKEWRGHLAEQLNGAGVSEFNRPNREELIAQLFYRYCDEVEPGKYLPKLKAPFSGQLFDTPAIERIFTYIPHVISQLGKSKEVFSYDELLLSLATFVENGTRSLIRQIEGMDIRKIIDPYVEPLEGGRYFKRREIPALPGIIKHIVELDPYEFESFVAHLLKAQGFTNVAIIGRSGDRGVDVVGNDESGKLTVVQCKRYVSNSVSATPVQRLHSFAVTRGAGRKILITTADFTIQAKQEAEITGTELISRPDLERLVSKYMPDMAVRGECR